MTRKAFARKLNQLIDEVAALLEQVEADSEDAADLHSAYEGLCTALGRTRVRA